MTTTRTTAFDQVCRSARAMLDAFGGDTPDWLRGEALSLATALEVAHNATAAPTHAARLLDDTELATVLAAQSFPRLLERCESFIAGFEDDADQDGIPELLGDLRAVIAAKPAPLPELPNESALCAELEAYCKAHDLPLMSADELASLDGIRDADRTWMRAYCERWDAFEESRRELHEACDSLGQAEGWALFNDDTSIQRDDEADRFASDEDALAYVRRMASAGSPVHAYALERLGAGKTRGPITPPLVSLRDALVYAVIATRGALCAIEGAAEVCAYPDADAMTMLLKRATNDARALVTTVHGLPKLARHCGHV